MKKLIGLLFLTFVTVSVFAQERDVEVIKKLNNDWLNAYPKRDTSTLSKILSDDFILITSHGAKVDKKSLISAIGNSAEDSIAFENKTVEVKIYGDVACLTGYGISTAYEKEGPDIGNNCYQSIFVRRNNVWKATETFIMLLKDDDK